MHAHHFAVLVTLAAISGVSAAHLVAPVEASAPLAGFVKTGLFVAREQPAPHAAAPTAPASCAGSMFSELGHGHPDVADAGYAAAHCPPYEEAASSDAGIAPSR